MPRLPLDAYMTPPHYIAALLAEVNIHGIVYEPCVGDGAIANALRALPSVRRVVTNDIDKRCKADTHFDAAHAASVGSFNWAVTNPPFSEEYEILQATLVCATNIAFLARLSFLEPTEERAGFLEEHPPTQMIVLPRYSFRNNDAGKRQTDNVTCAWLVWHADGVPRGISFYGRAKAAVTEQIQGLP
jgi:hypothetical protein